MGQVDVAAAVGEADLITRAVVMRLSMQLSPRWAAWQGALGLRYCACLMRMRPYLACRRPEIAAGVTQLCRETRRAVQVAEQAAAWEAGVLEPKTDAGLAVVALLLAQLAELASQAPAGMMELVEQAEACGYPTQLDGADGGLVEEMLILAQQVIGAAEDTNPRLWHELVHADDSRRPDLYWLATCAGDGPLQPMVADVRGQVKAAGFGFWYQPVGVATAVPAWPSAVWLLARSGEGNCLVQVWGGGTLPSSDEQAQMLAAMDRWVRENGAAYRIIDLGIYAARLGRWMG